MKFREVVTCKVLYGSVSDNNDPGKHSDLLKFPTEIDGTPITYTLEKKPYVEASVGVCQYFQVLQGRCSETIYLSRPSACCRYWN